MDWTPAPEFTCKRCGEPSNWLDGFATRTCFPCKNADNPYAGIRMSIDMGPQASTNPQRVAQGTADYNMALPGVVEEYGPRNAYGQRTIAKKRFVHNNEVATTRGLKERAKRAGMTMQETSKRAIPK